MSAPPITKPSPSPSPRPPLTTATSHQRGRIDAHWNDLPPSLLPSSSPSTRSPSTARTPTPSSPPTPSVPISELLEGLFSSAVSSLAEQECEQLLAKAKKGLAGMEEAQKEEMAGVLEGLMQGALAKKEARERVVAFVRGNPGTAGWGMCVRRGVEGVVEKEE